MLLLASRDIWIVLFNVYPIWVYCLYLFHIGNCQCLVLCNPEPIRFADMEPWYTYPVVSTVVI